MPESPDFESIAREALHLTSGAYGEAGSHITVDALAEQLRQVWNARPVPRCDQCRFWLQDGPDFGLCRMSSIDETFTDLPPVEERRLTSRDLRAITTRQDFGCVQWEAKP